MGYSGTPVSHSHSPCEISIISTKKIANETVFAKDTTFANENIKDSIKESIDKTIFSKEHVKDTISTKETTKDTIFVKKTTNDTISAKETANNTISAKETANCTIFAKETANRTVFAQETSNRAITVTLPNNYQSHQCLSSDLNGS
ncbi:bpi fold-containing family b member 2 [Limosa lapponica baueri]|uniref:Bpi fold-containing family b member 2 n=1 Tax=Limosa lapponica baueri TaxID=1758121 RepID=A0A2I0TLN4_LIMLA|nr:bpi fold-containing family b member 2 [Limosa lapponica baueri]